MNLFIVFLLLIVLVAFLLIVVIMVQNPKGGGLDSTFGGGSGAMIGGVKQTTDFLEKATWTLFGLMIGLILLSNTIVFKSTEQKEDIAVPEAIETPAPPAPQNNNSAIPVQETNGQQESNK